jgi:hypothetical protein
MDSLKRGPRKNACKAAYTRKEKWDPTSPLNAASLTGRMGLSTLVTWVLLFPQILAGPNQETLPCPADDCT